LDYKDKVVWITGASSGIGEHLAYAFAGEGAKLILSSRNEKELQRVRQNCRDSEEVMALPLDVTNYEAMEDAVQLVLNRFDFINILVNNAGLGQRSYARETDFKVDKKLMEINFLGAVALTKAVLPAMTKQQFGQIVVISSILGKVSVPRRSAYAASKHALHGYFDSLRAELFDDNIKVTIICPGYVHTNLPINALCADGSPNQRNDANRKGLEPAAFAQKAMQAIYKEKKEVYIGGFREVMAVYVKRWLPGLFFIIARRLRVS
jgi:dehydrogenase/reductase SDR family protein 7B